MKTNFKRLNYIDNLYAIGILLVLLGHSHSSDWDTFSGTILEYTITFIYTFHMPLFFFIAGFLFLNSHNFDVLGYKKWSADKSLKLLTPYIILSAIAAIPKYYVEQGNFLRIGSYLLKAIFAPRMGAWGHFWFIPVLMMVYLSFGLWKEYIGVSPITLIATFTERLWCIFYQLIHTGLHWVISKWQRYFLQSACLYIFTVQD